MQPSRNVIMKECATIEQNIKRSSIEEMRINMRILKNRKAPITDDVILDNQ